MNNTKDVLLEATSADVTLDNNSTGLNNSTISDIMLNNSTAEMVPTEVYIVNSLFQLLPSLASGFGNPLVIISIIKFRYLRGTANVFVVMLACFDFTIGLLGIVEIYALLETLYNSGTKFSFFHCEILGIVLVFLRTGNLICIMFMAIDRFIYITYPLRYLDIVTYKRVAIAVGFGIAYSPISSLFTILTNDKSTEKKICIIPETVESDYQIYFMVPEIIAVSVVLTVFYGQILRLALKNI